MKTKPEKQAPKQEAPPTVGSPESPSTFETVMLYAAGATIIGGIVLIGHNLIAKNPWGPDF